MSRIVAVAGISGHLMEHHEATPGIAWHADACGCGGDDLPSLERTAT